MKLSQVQMHQGKSERLREQTSQESLVSEQCVWYQAKLELRLVQVVFLYISGYKLITHSESKEQVLRIRIHVGQVCMRKGKYACTQRLYIS